MHGNTNLAPPRIVPALKERCKSLNLRCKVYGLSEREPQSLANAQGTFCIAAKSSPENVLKVAGSEELLDSYCACYNACFEGRAPFGLPGSCAKHVFCVIDSGIAGEDRARELLQALNIFDGAVSVFVASNGEEFR